MTGKVLHRISRGEVERAAGPNPWDLTNEILYALCREHPNHTDAEAILAKINIIGRVYAAAVERRKTIVPGETGDLFYLSRVVPEIRKSELDKWIAEAKETDPESESALDVLVDVHKRTTDLFNRISGLDKRSLASKYLHFHVPELFFIYDSRAALAIRSLRGSIGDARRPMVSGDREYSNFVARCASLRFLCESEFEITLSPRKLDNLLLAITRSSLQHEHGAADRIS